MHVRVEAAVAGVLQWYAPRFWSCSCELAISECYIVLHEGMTSTMSKGVGLRFFLTMSSLGRLLCCLSSRGSAYYLMITVGVCCSVFNFSD